MKCEYARGENTDASLIVHDSRGCFAVCPTHAHWRRFYCSRVGGHSKECRTPESDAHVTSIGTSEPVDASMSCSAYEANMWKHECGPWTTHPKAKP